jgi:hypothetical protein
MFKQTVAAAILILAVMVAGGVSKASAQESGTAKAAPEAAEPGHAYRLDFSVNEIEAGKKINSRQYSMNLSAGDANEVKIGTRVPVEAKQGEFQYIDVGTSIWCRLRDRKDVLWLGSDVLLNLRAEISNFALPEQQGQQVRPVLRQLVINASTQALMDKPMVVGSVDDPNSKRQFQLEVTVTKLR